MGESHRIADDAAWAAASALMAILEPVFRPEEVADAHALLFEHIRACVEAAFVMRNKEILKPELN